MNPNDWMKAMVQVLFGLIIFVAAVGLYFKYKPMDPATNQKDGVYVIQ